MRPLHFADNFPKLGCLLTFHIRRERERERERESFLLTFHIRRERERERERERVGVCVCVCVCVCMCTHACVRVRMYACMHVYEEETRNVCNRVKCCQVFLANYVPLLTARLFAALREVYNKTDMALG